MEIVKRATGFISDNRARFLTIVAEEAHEKSDLFKGYANELDKWEGREYIQVKNGDVARVPASLSGHSREQGNNQSMPSVQHVMER